MIRSKLKTDRRQLLLAGVALLAAGGIGFGIAAVTVKREPAVDVKAAVAPAQAEHSEGGEEGHSEEGHIEMDAARIKAAGLELLTTSAGPLNAEILASGDVKAQPQGEAVLAARADGVVTRINRRLGDSIRAGEVIAFIESRDASTIAAERSTGAARLTAARQTYEREKRLFEAKISPRQDLEAAEAGLAEARAEAGRSAAAAGAARVTSDGRSVGVVSPISGRITQAPAVLGSYVMAGAELFRVADAGRVEVHAAVRASDIGRVGAGDQATVETSTGTVPAVVRSITPGVDAQSRAATVVLSLVGPTGALTPGQAVRVHITPKAAAQSAGQIVVPEDAVQSVEGRDVVFVRNEEGFETVPVTISGRSGGRAEITSGLKPGQTIAGRGAFVLKAELGKGEAEHGH